MSASGEKVLVRTGLAEYAFSGEILGVRSRRLRSGATILQALVDSQVPFVFSYSGLDKIQVVDLQSYSSGEPIRGRYLSGLVSLHGIIAFRYEELIDHSMQARIVSIEELELRPAGKGLGGTKQLQSVDSYAAKQPVILGLEFDANG